MLVAAGTKLMYENINYWTNRHLNHGFIKHASNAAVQGFIELNFLFWVFDRRNHLSDEDGCWYTMASKQQGRINPSFLILDTFEFVPHGSVNFSAVEICWDVLCTFYLGKGRIFWIFPVSEIACSQFLSLSLSLSLSLCAVKSLVKQREESELNIIDKK